MAGSSQQSAQVSAASIESGKLSTDSVIVSPHKPSKISKRFKPPQYLAIHPRMIVTVKLPP